MTFKELKKKENLKNKDFAKWFDVNELTWNSSSAKDRLQNGIIRFYEHVKNKE